MRIVAFLLVMSSWVSTALAQNILPPKGAKPDAVAQDMRTCLATAERVAGGSGELLRGLDKELIQGNSTVGFLFEGSLAGARLVAPREDGILAPRESFFNALRSSSRTDPYVVCLLLKGYRWENAKETGVETLQRLADQGNIRAQVE